MRRLLRYYRQFDELSPDEVSRELLERRDEERRRHPAQQPPLDLSGAAWHGPPHPEAINAATFALRRAVNAYPDVTPLRNAIAASHDVDPARVVVGHGAGELIRAGRLRAIAQVSDTRIAGYPDVPTIREQGFDVPNVPQARGIVGPPNMPKEAVAYYQDLFLRASKSPSYIKYFNETQLVNAYLGPVELKAFITDYANTLRDILKGAGVKVVR